MVESAKGLQDVEVVETRISYIDGIKGVLEYRGHRIEELVDMDYEAVTHLLLYGELPDEASLGVFRAQMRAERPIHVEVQSSLQFCNPNLDAMDALRTAISLNAHCNPDLRESTPEANYRKGIAIIAKAPTIVAAFQRIREGREVVPPDPDLGHGENLLYMLRGERPSALEAEVIEKDLVLSAEHELNPSTFAARVTASTLSDMHSALISGINTLAGPLHGGARQMAMRYLDELESPEQAERHVMALIERRERVMGFGHRVYRTLDPRGRIYKEMARRVAVEHPERQWFDIAEAVERTVQRELVEKRGKPLYPNVDFYSAVMYKYLRMDPSLATSMFAVSRLAGWVAHVMEQYADNRLIRPRARTIRG